MAAERITLRSSDGEEFEVEAAVANMSKTLHHAIDGTCVPSCVSLPVDARTLAKVLDYCREHKSEHKSEEEDTTTDDAAKKLTEEAAKKLSEFDEAYIDIGMGELYNLVVAANYLDIKGLLDLCCQKAADAIKGKHPEEIRKTFGIKNDFPPEQEAEIKKELANMGFKW